MGAKLDISLNFDDGLKFPLIPLQRKRGSNLQLKSDALPLQKVSINSASKEAWEERSIYTVYELQWKVSINSASKEAWEWN